MTCVQPSVSTAVSFLITALRLLIFVTPIESTIVTTAARPSGIAATARETATINVPSIPSKVTPAPVTALRITSRAKINTQIPSTRKERIFES